LHVSKYPWHRGASPAIAEPQETHGKTGLSFFHVHLRRRQIPVRALRRCLASIALHRATQSPAVGGELSHVWRGARSGRHRRVEAASVSFNLCTVKEGSGRNVP